MNTGHTAGNQSEEPMDTLHAHLEALFDDLELVIGWETGYEPLRPTPLF